MLRQDRLQNSFKVFAESTGTVIKSFGFPITLKINEEKGKRIKNINKDILKSQLHKSSFKSL